MSLNYPARQHTASTRSSSASTPSTPTLKRPSSSWSSSTAQRTFLEFKPRPLDLLVSDQPEPKARPSMADSRSSLVNDSKRVTTPNHTYIVSETLLEARPRWDRPSPDHDKDKLDSLNKLEDFSFADIPISKSALEFVNNYMTSADPLPQSHQPQYSTRYGRASQTSNQSFFPEDALLLGNEQESSNFAFDGNPGFTMGFTGRMGSEVMTNPHSHSYASGYNPNGSGMMNTIPFGEKNLTPDSMIMTNLKVEAEDRSKTRRVEPSKQNTNSCDCLEMHALQTFKLAAPKEIIVPKANINITQWSEKSPMVGYPIPPPPEPIMNPDRRPDSITNASYLLFYPSVQTSSVLDHRGEPVQISIKGKLAGNFFLSHSLALEDSTSNNRIDTQTKTAEKFNTSSSSTEIVAEPASTDLSIQPSYELTFYRRNLFQVKSLISNCNNAAYVTDISNANSGVTSSKSRIISLSLDVMVSENNNDPPLQLLYCPPKGIFPTTDSSQDQHSINSSKDQEPSLKYIYPKATQYDEVVDWKRLQFRTATANNGRKKFQKFFFVCVLLFAELENTKRVRLAYAFSRPIVVRGRNPRFYQNRDNILLPETASSHSRGIIERPLTQTTTTAMKSTVFVEDTNTRVALQLSHQLPQSNLLAEQSKQTHEEDDDLREQILTRPHLVSQSQNRTQLQNRPQTSQKILKPRVRAQELSKSQLTSQGSFHLEADDQISINRNSLMLQLPQQHNVGRRGGKQHHTQQQQQKYQGFQQYQQSYHQESQSHINQYQQQQIQQQLQQRQHIELQLQQHQQHQQQLQQQYQQFQLDQKHIHAQQHLQNQQQQFPFEQSNLQGNQYGSKSNIRDEKQYQQAPYNLSMHCYPTNHQIQADLNCPQPLKTEIHSIQHPLNHHLSQNIDKKNDENHPLYQSQLKPPTLVGSVPLSQPVGGQSVAEYPNKLALSQQLISPTTPITTISSPIITKDKDIDYEYFPLPREYWAPLVAVAYRPHTTHPKLNEANRMSVNLTSTSESPPNI